VTLLRTTIKEIYEALSEVAHPNAAGSNLFWKHDLDQPPIESSPVFVFIKSKYGVDFDLHHLVVEAILWAIGFSAAYSVQTHNWFQELAYTVKPGN
jgi:hypothetical protein